jgi:hypothetical protein
MRTISAHEFERRKAMASASTIMTDAMMEVTQKHELTVIEWLKVLNALVTRMIEHGMTEEWNEIQEARSDQT